MDKIDKNVQAIISRIRVLREEKGISQLELSLQSGISQTMISQMESGKKIPTLSTFLRICSALNVSPESIIQESLSSDEKRKKDKQVVLKIIEKWL